MDLMYGSGPDYDLSLQEMIEGDLKSGDDFLGRVPYSSSSEDFLDMQMGELGPGGLFGEYGFEELGMHFDSSENLYLDALSDHHHVSVVSNSSSSTKSSSSSSGHGTSTTTITTAANSSGGVSVGGVVVKSAAVGVPRHSRQSNNKSTSSVYITSWNSLLNRSDNSKGISFEESLGIMVDPSSIVPASLSGSTGSSSIGSETDPECLATDDESESELASTGSIAAWIVPDPASRSPSPVVDAEFELEEPEFILPLRGGSQSVSEPPAKKRKQKHDPQPHPIDGKIYPKPGFSYSCLIAMSLKNSKTGCLPVSEIYKFMCDHFPYFKTAPSGWKNSVRHNLSLNKCFEKIEKPGNGARKGCLWALNPNKIHKMDEEVQKWSRKDPLSIRRAMSDPENLELLEKGELKKDYSGNGSDEDEDEEFVEASGSVNPAQLIVRKLNGQTTSVTTSPVQYTTVSQVHASMNRPAEQKIHVAKKDEALEFGTITNVQGNYICTTPGSQTYTLSFSNLGSSTPIIIRRTQVK